LKQRIKDFWIKSYTSDKTAFCCEMFSFVVTVAASLTLAITAAQPNMLIVYPGFFIGSLAAVVAYYRRGLAWPLVLTTYFALNNIFGFGRAALWW
jgi:hypothetical protein